MSTDVIFEPLKFRNLAVKNRIFRRNSCGAVPIARSFGANNDLARTFAAGHDRRPAPCAYGNDRLVNDVENSPGATTERASG